MLTKPITTFIPNKRDIYRYGGIPTCSVKEAKDFFQDLPKQAYKFYNVDRAAWAEVIMKQYFEFKKS